MSVKRWLLSATCLGAMSLPIASAQNDNTLSFEQAVTLASESPAVQLAEGQLEFAREQLGAASGVVSASLSTDYIQTYRPATADESATSTGNFGAVTVEASLNVVPYGDVSDSVTRAEWAVENAEAALEDTEADAVVNIATQYLEALRYSQEEEAAAAAVGVAQTALEATQTRLSAGAASDADLLDAQIALSEAQNDLAEVALEQDQALATLSQTLGVSVTAVSGEPPTATLPELGNTNALLADRSDVRSATLAVQEAELSASAALRDVLPSGGVSASYSTSGTTLGAGIGTETYQPSVSLAYDPDGSTTGATSEGLSAQIGLSIPLNSGSGSGLAAAQTAVSNAQRQLEQTRAQAELELQAARNQLATAQNSLDAAQALVQQRQQSLETTRTRLELGLVAAFEVESAEASLLDAQVQFARLQDSVLTAQLSLLQTLSLDPSEVL